jgi:phospholipid/cholesterol/gamma-HCH transport system substrate-binding protein
MSTPFREKNPVVVGAVSLAVILGLILLAFNAEKLPIIGGGDTYYADFSEAGGLVANDEVRIAGVRVGKVDSVSLDGDHVKVAFRISTGAQFGTATRAAIKIKTLLGAMYISLEPAGPGQLAKGAEIPVARTQSPYDVVQAFSGLGRTSEQINTHQLARSLTTLADLTRNTPKDFRHALAGVSALSGNLAARDSQIGTLLQNLRSVSHTLNARDQDIVGLMRDSQVLFKALYKRRQAVHNLLRSTSELSVQLTSLVRQSRADLKPALTHLSSVVDLLNKDSDNIDQSIRLLAPFYRVFANTLGDGPWFDTYIQNIPPVPQLPKVGG